MKLSKENIDKLIFGGIYTADSQKIAWHCSRYNDQLNDQKYGLWIPTHRYNEETKEHEYWMIDTYQISRDLFYNLYNNDPKIKYQGLIDGLGRLRNPDDGGNWAYTMPWDYYYKARVKLDDITFKLFTLKADLREYEIVSENESRNYSSEDIIHRIRLYHEHAYPRGIILKKLNATLNYYNKINTKVSDILSDIETPKTAYESDINDLLSIEKEAISQNAEYDKEKVEATIKYNEFIKKQKHEYEEFYKEIRNDLHGY